MCRPKSPNFGEISQTLADVLLCRFLKTNACHDGILLPVSILTYLSSSACHSTEWSRKNARSLMHRHFATVCSRITRLLQKMLRKDHCIPVSEKFVSVCCTLFNKHVMNDVTLHVNMILLTVEDRLLINTVRIDLPI